MLQDAVVAIVSEDRLPDLLPVIHRAGMGYLTRVATAKRGPVLDQLQRAGIPVSQAPELAANSTHLLFINAGGRAIVTGSLLVKADVDLVWIVNGLGAWNQLDDTVLATRVVPPAEVTVPQTVPGRRDDQHPVAHLPSSDVSSAQH